MPAAEAEAQAPTQDLASPGLSGGPARPQHIAPDRGLPRLALPREPASPAGDEAGRRPRGAQHKGLFPGAAAAAAPSLEPPAEAEPAPGPSSPQVPGGGCCPSPRDPGPRALSPLFLRLRRDPAAAQAPLLPAVRAPRSMWEESDMEKAIKVRGRCPLPPRFVSVTFLSAPTSESGENLEQLPGFGFHWVPWTAFYSTGAKGLCAWGGTSDSLRLTCLKQGYDSPLR